MGISKAEREKAKVIAEFRRVRGALVAAAAAVPEGRQDEAFIGSWSINDLVAHLIGWDETNLAAVKQILAGQMPAIYSHYDKDWATYNAGLVAQHKQVDLAGTLEAMGRSDEALVAFLDEIPAEEFLKDRGLRSGRFKVTVAQMIKFETHDEKRHLKQVEGFLGDS